MINNDKLMKKLTKDANRLQNKIKYRKLYNIRNAVVRPLIKSGIAVDYALPFIIVAIIVANAHSSEGNVPFRADEIVKKASIETIDTSSGIHLEHLSFDFDYDDELIEYSTGWIINEQGLYERTVTSYRLDDKIDLENKEKILEMTKDDIDNALVITNIKTVKKSTLDPEDEIYNSDAIIVIDHSDSEEETITRLETKSENFWYSLYYIVLVLCCGNSVRCIEKVFVKTYIRDKLRKYEPFFRKINKKELEQMKKILKMKQENLSMLNGDNNSDIDRYSYKLRKI